MNAETRRHATGKYFYIIHPYSKMEIYREMLFILTSYWYVIILPVRTSFEWVYTTRPTLLNFVSVALCKFPGKNDSDF